MHMLTRTCITNSPTSFFSQVFLQPYATGSPATETAQQMKFFRSKAKIMKKWSTNVLRPGTAMVATQSQYNSLDWFCIVGHLQSLAFSVQQKVWWCTWQKKLTFKCYYDQKIASIFVFRFWKCDCLTLAWQNFELWFLSKGCLLWV